MSIPTREVNTSSTPHLENATSCSSAVQMPLKDVWHRPQQTRPSFFVSLYGPLADYKNISEVIAITVKRMINIVSNSAVKRRPSPTERRMITEHDEIIHKVVIAPCLSSWACRRSLLKIKMGHGDFPFNTAVEFGHKENRLSFAPQYRHLRLVIGYYVVLLFDGSS